MEHLVVLKVMKTTQSWNIVEVQPQQMPFTQWTTVLRFQPTILFLHRYSWQTLKSIFLREQMNVHFLSWRNWVRRDAIAVVWARINHKMANNNCLFVFIQMPSEKAGLEKVTTSEKYSIPELQQNTTGSSLCQQATSHLPMMYNCKSNMRLLTLLSGFRINTDIGLVLIFGSQILGMRSRRWDFVFLRRFERCHIFHLWETKTLEL